MVKRRKKNVPKSSKEYIPSYEEVKAELELTNWSKAALFKLLTNAHSNSLKSLINLEGHLKLAKDVVDAFEKTQKKLAYSNEHELNIAALFSRAYGSFLASIGLASSGQLAESWAVSRACIENALYAFYMHDDVGLFQIWSEREKSKQDKTECRKYFQHSKVIGKLKAKHSKLANRANKLYQKCIDYGAHPTQWSVATNSEILKQQGRQVAKILLLNCEDSYMRTCLLLGIDAGLCALSIFNMVYPDEFKGANIPIVIFNIETTFRALALDTAGRLRSERRGVKK